MAAELAGDARLVAQERGELAERGRPRRLALGRILDPAGGEQLAQHQHLEPVATDLAPQRPDRRHGRLVLRMIRGRHSASHFASWRRIPRVLVGQKEEVPAGGRGGAVHAERALPASVAGPPERAPFRREASAWAGVGSWHGAGSGGGHLGRL